MSLMVLLCYCIAYVRGSLQSVLPSRTTTIHFRLLLRTTCYRVVVNARTTRTDIPYQQGTISPFWSMLLATEVVLHRLCSFGSSTRPRGEALPYAQAEASLSRRHLTLHRRSSSTLWSSSHVLCQVPRAVLRLLLPEFIANNPYQTI